MNTERPEWPESAGEMPNYIQGTKHALPDRSGMTLCEWYAGMAMVAILSKHNFSSTATIPDLAEHAFRIADEMMKSSEMRPK